MRIFLVDDDASMRVLMRALLEKTGHSLAGEAGGVSGLAERVAASGADAVCLDVELPDGSGFDALRELSEKLPTVDVLMVTATDTPETRERAATEGATGYIAKPFRQSVLAGELAAVETSRKAASMKTECLNGKSVLVVDDSMAMRSLAKGLLESMGLRVAGAAANGTEGEEMARSLKPDAVFLDVEMPVMNGLAALPRIRAAVPATKIVMMTARCEREFVAMAKRNGADAYVLKPVRADYLKGVVEKLGLMT